VVLAVNSVGQPMGACLGNDFTLRDYEGRSALLLGHAKDNNASCAIGPLLRLFDEGFTMDDVRGAEVLLQVTGHDGYEERGTNALSEISRDPEQLISAAIGPMHQYPDGLMLFLGTMFVPGRDRNGPGSGFTHAPGDRVRVYSSRLGSLINDVVYSDQAPPWTFGVRALTRSLAARGVLPG
jgi:fumarylacetoacetate (FAA) hydrolase family protein